MKLINFLKGTRNIPVWVLLIWLLAVLVLPPVGYRLGWQNMLERFTQQASINKNSLDPTLLEQAISKELLAQDTYDVTVRQWINPDELRSTDELIIHFSITGQARKTLIDFRQFD